MSERILVVDDSSLARRTLRQILESGGFEVEEASDGAQALERYFLNPHRLVLLDMVMEHMDGFEVLQKFRELNPNAQIVIATADIQTSTREQARAAGAAGIINKPFTRERVLEVVNNVCQGTHLWS